MRKLTLAFSPCPNDTFAFHALVHGLVDAPFQVEPVLLDIEELNRHGRLGTYDVSKLSFGVLPGVGDRYRMLRSGAALGRGVGPLVVAREPQTLAGAAAGRSPSRAATPPPSCCCGSPRPSAGEVEVLRYDRILDAVADRRGRRRADHPREPVHLRRPRPRARRRPGRVVGGDDRPADPAGGHLRAQRPRRGVAGEVERAIRASVEYAFAHPEASREWVREHAQELSDDVCDQHIALYVNEFSIDLGDEGLEAIDRLLQRAPVRP